MENIKGITFKARNDNNGTERIGIAIHKKDFIDYLLNHTEGDWFNFDAVPRIHPVANGYTHVAVKQDKKNG